MKKHTGITERNVKQGWILAALILAALWMVSCGDAPIAPDVTSTTITPRPALHGPDNPQHVPDGALVVEISTRHLDAMSRGDAGSDPFYFFHVDGIDVVIKRVD